MEFVNRMSSETPIVYTQEYRGWEWYGKRILIAIGVILLLVLIYYLFKLGIINIGITVNDENGSIVFSLLNGMIMGMYLTALGWSLGASKWWQKLVLILIIGIYLYLGFTYIGFKFCTNLSFFLVKCYETNTPAGIEFFLGNILLFGFIFAITFVTEGEKIDE